MIHALVLALVAPGTALAAGKDFVIGLWGDATAFNPVVATDSISYITEWPIFDSLLELDQSLNVRPLLAESWETSRDGLTYTFKLKKGVTWHDGKPFTARDVAFTYYAGRSRCTSRSRVTRASCRSRHSPGSITRCGA